MVKIICDKCGKESKHTYVVDLPVDKSTMVSSHNITIKYYDLCADCFEELKNWIKKDE